MRSIETFIALNRFGLGAGPGDDALVGDDPRGWLRAQIRRDLPLPDVLSGFPSSSEIRTRVAEGRMESPEARRAAIRSAREEVFMPEILARARLAATTRAGLAERMVRFWSNHFTVSTNRGLPNGVTIPAYEREAIRPHVFGRFADMLLAVAQHPTMLTYLDNIRSIGPESRAGRRRRENRGTLTTLNENFARELLELHTLGVDGGYTQEDVVNLALILTGWSVAGYRGGDAAASGQFAFQRRRHQPGDKVVLGRVYAEAGVDEGLAVLADLARHPSTARHLATKLVRHFVADDPPEADVARIARVFQDSDGDLAQVTAALIELPSAWADPLAKVKTHEEFILAMHRAAGHVPPVQRHFIYPLRLLAAVPLSAPSPQGWGDRAGDWIGPEALMIRLEWARGFAATLPATLVPRDVLEDSIGAVAREATSTWVHRAPSGDAALAMIFSAPEFQRR